MIVTAAPIDADLLRLRHEFLCMPGLCLSVPQAARLIGVRLEHATNILTTLEAEGFLMQMADGTFRRPNPLMS